MNPAFDVRSPRNGWHHARANHNILNAEHSGDTESVKGLQARYLRTRLGCSAATALILANLAYGDGQ
jgi:hypothetical protein